MATLNKYVQTNTFYLAGSGVIIGATSITLTSFTDIYGNVLTMTDFGTTGYITLEPDTTNEECAIFTGVSANANGTYTLTGVSTTLAKSPYTATSGLVRQHSGGTKVVVTDNVAFWNTFPNKANDETVTGQWTFTNTPIIPGTVSDASTTVKGVAKISVAPALSTSPIAVGVNDVRVPIGYAVDSVGTDAYAISPAYAITSYVAGQIFTFKAGTANTGAASLNVSTLGAKTIKKNVSSDLATGDILLNQIVTVVYDGTNMQIISPLANTVNTYTNKFSNGIATKTLTDASAVQTIAHGLGVIPSKVKLRGLVTFGSTQPQIESTGAYDSSGQNCLYTYVQFFSGSSYTTILKTDATHAIVMESAGNDINYQSGTVTVDSTNITITWIKTGSPTGTASILWEAEY